MGADGINSDIAGVFGRARASDYQCQRGFGERLLLKTKDVIKDPELGEFATDPQVNYWMGSDAHTNIFPFL